MTTPIARPQPSEYAGYYGLYIARVPEGNILDLLETRGESTRKFLEAIPAERAEFRYAPGKWTTREVLRHVVDLEWVFTYRALSFARGLTDPLPGVDQDAMMAAQAEGSRDLPALVEEFAHLRTAGVALFRSLDPGVFTRRGTASGCDFTVRAILYIIAGHAEHHIEVLRKRYLDA